MRKKANVILDTIMIVIVIFSFTLLSIIGYKVFSQVNDTFQSNDLLANESKEQLDQFYTKYPSLMDGLFLLALILLWIAAIISSFMIDSHPIFLVVTVILTVFLLLLGAVFSNVYEEISTGDALSESASAFPITNFLMSRLYIIVLAIATSITIVLFAKFKNG